LEETGKIYVKDDLLFVNEQRQGIHVIDNRNPASARMIAFLDIPGNVDIAVRGHILYADSGRDLVVADISDPVRATEIGRIRDIFPPEEPQWSPGGGCFPAGTPVLTAAGSRAIETIRPGTEVYGWDLAAKRWILAEVDEIHTHDYTGEMITIEAGTNVIRATGNHPFFILDGDGLSARPEPLDVPASDRGTVGPGRWVEAGYLKTGDVLKSRIGERLVITKVLRHRENTLVYNIGIDGCHNYAVSPGGALVHNKGGQETAAAPSAGTGKGGSLARFTIVGDYLYTLSGSAMQLFDITEPAEPLIWEKVDIGWDIETIFPYQDKLFIGGMTGMYIFDNRDPAKPRKICRFAHVTSCDPVVVEGNYAYVTLRGGSRCGGLEDQLQIIDITDISNPRLIRTHRMHGPYGLGIDQGTLFICDGGEGLKMFDARNPENLQPMRNFYDIHPIDVILDRKRAIVVGRGGLYQYDYRNLDDVRLISLIPAR
jgi:hypothetical protein